jgi:hypothetical protein
MTGNVVVVVAGLVVVVGLGFVVDVAGGRVDVGATESSADGDPDDSWDAADPTATIMTTRPMTVHPHTGRRPTRRDNQVNFIRWTVRRGCQRVDSAK